MPQICEITRKKVPHFSNLPEDQKTDAKAHQRILLKRKFKLPEIKGSINLKVSSEGLELVKQAGGLAAFLKDRADSKLSTRLLKLKRRIHGEPKPEKPAEEKAAEAPAPETKAEEKPSEKSKEEGSGEKPEEKPKEEAKPEEKPKEEAKPEEKPAEEKDKKE